MGRFTTAKKKPEKCQFEIARFIRSLKNYPFTKQQIKTLRGQALSGNLAGAQRGLERMVARHENNRAF